VTVPINLDIIDGFLQVLSSLIAIGRSVRYFT